VAELKTKKTKASVDAFIGKVADPVQREDCRQVLKLMREATGSTPAMWGTSIVGFGNYQYAYDSGRDGEWFQMGFAPRKGTLTLYIMPGVERYPQHLKKLGKHSTGRSCLYIKKLDDVDVDVLRSLLKDAVKDLRASAQKRDDT
jgi:uncharacterized protein DUF1801